MRSLLFDYLVMENMKDMFPKKLFRPHQSQIRVDRRREDKGHHFYKPRPSRSDTHDKLDGGDYHLLGFRREKNFL